MTLIACQQASHHTPIAMINPSALDAKFAGAAPAAIAHPLLSRDEDPDFLHAQACWEDALDLLGTQPDINALRTLLAQAPDKQSAAYHFAAGYLTAIDMAM